MKSLSKRTTAPTRHAFFCAMLGALSLVPAKAQAASPFEANTPIDYRCDKLHLRQSTPKEARCEGHVMIRQGAWLLCCDTAVGRADDQWRWLGGACRGAVRLQHGDEMMWADEARFDAATNRLVLEGRPVLSRGNSTLRGRRIVVSTQQQSAQIEAPQGSLSLPELKEGAKIPVELSALQALPARCPLPERL